jgi:hypothetical protein
MQIILWHNRLKELQRLISFIKVVRILRYSIKMQLKLVLKDLKEA